MSDEYQTLVQQLQTLSLKIKTLQNDKKDYETELNQYSKIVEKIIGTPIRQLEEFRIYKSYEDKLFEISNHP